MAVPSVPRFYGWAQLTYQATRGRSGTAPGRGHQRGQKGGKVWIRVPAPKRAQVGTFWPAGVPGVHPAPPPPQPNYEKGGVFQNVGGGWCSRSRPGRPWLGGGPGQRPAVPAWGHCFGLRIYRRRSVQIQANTSRAASSSTPTPARTIASNGSMAASMPAQAPGGNPGGRIGAQPCAQAGTLRGRHPRPHPSTGAADPAQGGGAGGRGENRGGGSGVSICPEKLSLLGCYKRAYGGQSRRRWRCRIAPHQVGSKER